MPGQVALALQRRPRRHAHLGPHLARQQVRQRGLAQAGRPRQQHVVERVAALARRLDVDGQVVGDLPLADELGEAARPQRRVVVALAAPRRRRADATRARAPRASGAGLVSSSCRFARHRSYPLRSAASASRTSSANGLLGVHARRAAARISAGL